MRVSDQSLISGERVAGSQADSHQPPVDLKTLSGYECKQTTTLVGTDFIRCWRVTLDLQDGSQVDVLLSRFSVHELQKAVGKSLQQILLECPELFSARLKDHGTCESTPAWSQFLKRLFRWRV